MKSNPGSPLPAQCGAADAQPAALRERFINDVLSNGTNRAILADWHRLGLADGWLVAGCLFQTAWNLHCGRPAQAGIRDYDIFYFDGRDLSPEAEAAVQRRVDRVLGPLGAPVEVKNQARVHLWYEEEFGFPYAPLASSCDGIDRFLIPATCVGIRPAAAGYDVHAPNGLDLLYAGRLTPNPLVPHRALFEAKARSYVERWEGLRVCGS